MSKRSLRFVVISAGVLALAVCPIAFGRGGGGHGGGSHERSEPQADESREHSDRNQLEETRPAIDNHRAENSGEEHSAARAVIANPFVPGVGVRTPAVDRAVYRDGYRGDRWGYYGWGGDWGPAGDMMTNGTIVAPAAP